MPALVTGSLQATVSLPHTTQQLPGMGIGTAAPVGAEPGESESAASPFGELRLWGAAFAATKH